MQIGKADSMAIFGDIAISSIISAALLFAISGKLIRWMYRSESISKNSIESEQVKTA